MIITFGGPRMGFIMSPHPLVLVSLVGEECMDLNTDHFKRIPGKQFGGVIKFQNQIWFQRGASTLICIGIAFFLHPQFTHFHVFPLSVTCSAVSKRNTIPLSVFIWCADSAAQAKREEKQKKKERRKERGLSDRHLRIRNLVFQHKAFVESVVSGRSARRIQNCCNTASHVHVRKVCVTCCVYCMCSYIVSYGLKQTRMYNTIEGGSKSCHTLLLTAAYCTPDHSTIRVSFACLDPINHTKGKRHFGCFKGSVLVVNNLLEQVEMSGNSW